ncbi:protein of unknown function [Kyrpidia spormannii]|uniref:Uncharacterized protein n=1 Tax=Kyrpidia spormannii TaxID=2055160 RepID=A0ACA8ZF18_9BACL|nr:protein of unknown function [Kyrpidia spormannii]
MDRVGSIWRAQKAYSRRPRLTLTSLGSHHQMPASYEAVWPLPRPDLHRQVVPSFARRAVSDLTLTLSGLQKTM